MKPEFFAALRATSAVTLVGPIHGREHHPENPTIYVDGGARFRAPSGGAAPSFSLGDGDSGGGALDRMLPADKDHSDLAAALALLPAEVRLVHLAGFLGGRTDHELMNFGEVHRFLMGRSGFTRVDFQNREDRVPILAFHGGPMEMEIHGEFSVFTFAPVALAEIAGDCRYPLTVSSMLKGTSSQGLSNVGHGRVSLRADVPLFVFLN